jgi:hypothetical protein
MEHVVTIKHCLACGKEFTPHPQVRNHSFCSAPECQRERHRRWQKAKRAQDANYRKVDAEYNQAWAYEHPDYWGQYREKNPDYVKRNREQQQKRNHKDRKASGSLKEGELSSFPAGRYQLIRIDAAGIANGNAWIVEIKPIACGAIVSTDSHE